MLRSATALLALCAALALAAAALPAATAAGSAASATAQTAAASAAAAKKSRAQKRRACLKKANRRSGAAARRSRTACRRRFGPRKPGAKPPGAETVTPPPATAPDQSGTSPTQTQTGSQTQEPATPPDMLVRDDAKFREALKSAYLHRQYAVPKPNHGAGYNYHDENYEFCESVMGHLYEGISYIYKSVGPWQVVEGNVSGDGSKGSGTIRFTQAEANFAEEVGKVQTIQIQWDGDQAAVAHPEIGTNAFARHVKPAPCTQ